MSTIQESVVEVFVSRFDLDAESVVPEATFDDLGLDSLSQIELATALKKRLGVVITDAELTEIETVSDITALIEQKAAAV
ncbi:acyl carrier protein [Streptomyces antarcticus]|uniref:acyl carrier protein n=1 Tax=Streptomyces antarcticus TaxID=2996458 RepID=UPI00226FF450|nr:MULTISPECIES: acyl carrier protein [unclassified Streptomyces]MCY0942863.1 acyl carrier protein [Streptomyces sp. H34-AA3]MCY0953090.1 acyl carrier protein [Streptomyces sp. H27-S2]MCZ4087883.1 acyl carrier protein [Streptomyces sp. H34-S5]